MGKPFGDGLIPDTHAALRALGVYDEVSALATRAPEVRFTGPRGGHIDIPGHLSVLPRRTLDHVLVRAAQRAGATLLAPLRFESPSDRTASHRRRRIPALGEAART